MYFDASRTRRDSLDAITCGSIFAGDKGRYLTADDIARGYAEPFEEDPETGVMRPLDREARYPPRRDVVRCSGMSCFDHPDVDRYDADARTAMPELDAVTFATPQGDEELTLLLPVPDDLPSRDYYVVWLEVNSEGDYGGAFESVAYPTPDSPTDRWDYWALAYGYPYRGQPSVVFQVPVGFDAPDGTRTSVSEPLFYTSVHGLDAELHAFGDGAIVDDSEGAPGSGADRLRRGPDRRRLYAGTRDLPCR